MRNNIIKKLGPALIILHFMCTAYSQVPEGFSSTAKSVRIRDKNGILVLNVNCDRKCVIDYVETEGRPVVSNPIGVFSSVKYDGKIFSTGSGIKSPLVTTDGDIVTINGIVFGEAGNLVSERWVFRPDSGWIDWTIERTYQGNITLEDTGFPEWSFDSMDTWTGGLLGTGGVAWCRFFDRINASLGNHTGKITLWNQTSTASLGIVPSMPEGQFVAIRLSRQPDNRFTLNYTVSEDRLRTKHFLARFIIDRQDIWDAFDARGTLTVTYRLLARKWDDASSRGEFRGFSNESVSALLNTIARVGIIDENLMGSNNWHLDMGYVCLHEQWIAQMGLAIDDQDYFDNYRKTLDYFRDNAISADGNVKDRWAYRLWDSEPGTFRDGFYECQWGDLLDANTDYVINVSELFQTNGDTAWVKSHRAQCEKALGFLLSRDSDGNGLIEAYTSSHLQNKGSDWIDVIWASWENALINAKLYYALTQWASVEEITGDALKAGYFRNLAEKCKFSFNKPVKDGGFWNPEQEWYIYWRDKDGSAHGDNLVTPVNFMAIAYGICDDKNRKEAVLSKIETLMQKEKLFMWPISFFPYQPDEGFKVNYPFPNYENGDIFLAWGEVGIRAYQDFDPSIPVKYIKNVLNQYEKDGLAFQRYDRKRQEGAGSDILANNSLPVVGLYRDIYGIQPQYNRLYIDPHLTEELNGTRINYRLRNQDWNISLSVSDYSISSEAFTINSAEDFGISTGNNAVQYYKGNNSAPSLSLTRDKHTPLLIRIIKWNTDNSNMIWKALPSKSDLLADYDITVNVSGRNFDILRNGKMYKIVRSDSYLKIHFSIETEKDNEDIIEIRQSE